MHRSHSCRPSYSTIERRIDEGYDIIHKSTDAQPTTYLLAAMATWGIEEIIAERFPECNRPYTTARRLVAQIIYTTPRSLAMREASRLYRAAFTEKGDELATIAVRPYLEQRALRRAQRRARPF